MNREVVVSGIGLVTPCGWGTGESWQRLLAGTNCAVWLDELHDAHDARTRWAGMPVAGVSLREPFRLRRFALAAATEALQDAGLRIGEHVDPTRVGCVIGLSKSDLTAFHRWAAEDRSLHPCSGDAQVHDLLQAALFAHDPATHIAGRFGLQGAVLCPMAACATGLVSLIQGVQLIRSGVCDAVLAGSVDAPLAPALLGCYSRMQVMASAFTDPREAMRPFDSQRSGFLVGEGAGVMVLESADSARSRARQPVAKVLGCSLGSDPTGMTDIDTTGTLLARVMRDAVQRSALSLTDVDAVHVHGTATQQNDLCEARALQAVWRGHPVPPVSSIKGAIGHLLGGAGSVETAFAALSLRDQVIPPSINSQQVDAECRLDLSTLARPLSARRALKLSLGFGGHLAAIVLEQA